MAVKSKDVDLLVPVFDSVHHAMFESPYRLHRKTCRIQSVKGSHILPVADDEVRQGAEEALGAAEAQVPMVDHELHIVGYPVDTSSGEVCHQVPYPYCASRDKPREPEQMLEPAKKLG